MSTDDTPAYGSHGLRSSTDDHCLSCGQPWPCGVAILGRQVSDLEAEVDEYAQLADRQTELLTGVANVLNGPPPERTIWSHHDLPEKAAKLAERLSVLEGHLAALGRFIRDEWGVADSDDDPTAEWRGLDPHNPELAAVEAALAAAAESEDR